MHVSFRREAVIANQSYFLLFSFFLPFVVLNKKSLILNLPLTFIYIRKTKVKKDFFKKSENSNYKTQKNRTVMRKNSQKIFFKKISKKVLTFSDLCANIKPKSRKVKVKSNKQTLTKHKGLFKSKGVSDK